MPASRRATSGADDTDPIGGFFGLETPGRAGSRADFGPGHRLDFWNARAALAHLFAVEGVRRVWLPAYICRAAAEAADRDGREVRFYAVGDALTPEGADVAAQLRRGDAVLGVDYFGAPRGALPELAARFPDVVWVQDRAQALWPEPAPWGRHVLYSPRKMVGVADGGVLVSGERLAPPLWAPDEDLSRLEPARMRAADPTGARRDVWFPAYRATEAAMDVAPRPMSEVSHRILDALDRPAIAEARRRNAECLLEQVGEHALFDATRLLAGAPLGVPVLTDDAGAVAARMAERRVFCARHWADLPSPAAEFTAEHALSRRLLTLPCDHRYDAADMARVADTFLACR
ncbi:hypothetical protein ACO2Q0_20050 [Phenylobacterium sp. VNQ135]|uniref:hypothetical protein n=1 Tax=Phenylobacterium sp. VNQ135 TaxID=3400922 RepID=UPI003C070822